MEVRGTEQTKPLTRAQQRHLLHLQGAVLQAQQALNNFVAYLREEHDAPAPEWEIYDVQQGFVKRDIDKPSPKTSGN